MLTTDTEISSVTVSHVVSQDETITVHAPENITLDLPQGVQPVISCDLPASIEAESSPQNIEADLTVSIDGEILYTKKIMVQIPAESNLLDKIILFFKNHL